MKSSAQLATRPKTLETARTAAPESLLVFWVEVLLLLDDVWFSLLLVVEAPVKEADVPVWLRQPFPTSSFIPETNSTRAHYQLISKNSGKELAKGTH